MENSDVTEKILAWQKAWEAIPKARFKRETHLEGDSIVASLSCPECGAMFAQMREYSFYSTAYPIICCGKLMI